MYCALFRCSTCKLNILLGKNILLAKDVIAKARKIINSFIWWFTVNFKTFDNNAVSFLTCNYVTRQQVISVSQLVTSSYWKHFAISMTWRRSACRQNKFPFKIRNNFKNKSNPQPHNPSTKPLTVFFTKGCIWVMLEIHRTGGLPSSTKVIEKWRSRDGRILMKLE